MDFSQPVTLKLESVTFSKAVNTRCLALGQYPIEGRNPQTSTHSSFAILTLVNQVKNLVLGHISEVTFLSWYERSLIEDSICT
jgi:hypothetical protein